MASKRRNLLRAIWVALLLSTVIGSLLPGTSLPMELLDRFELSDKLVHFVAYACLALLPALHERRATTGALVILILMLGVLLEFAQSYSDDRFFEMRDMAANWCGALCGVLLGIPFRA